MRAAWLAAIAIAACTDELAQPEAPLPRDQAAASAADLPATGSNADLTSFAFLAADNPALSSDVVATFLLGEPNCPRGCPDENLVDLQLPAGTDRSALVATFTTTGSTVLLDGVAQASDVTANDFTTRREYTVVARDNSTKTYEVAAFLPP